jgi:hypothetical protein
MQQPAFIQGGYTIVFKSAIASIVRGATVAVTHSTPTSDMTNMHAAREDSL